MPRGCKTPQGQPAVGAGGQAARAVSYVPGGWAQGTRDSGLSFQGGFTGGATPGR